MLSLAIDIPDRTSDRSVSLELEAETRMRQANLPGPIVQTTLVLRISADPTILGSNYMNTFKMRGVRAFRSRGHFLV